MKKKPTKTRQIKKISAEQINIAAKALAIAAAQAGVSEMVVKYTGLHGPSITKGDWEIVVRELNR